MSEYVLSEGEHNNVDVMRCRHDDCFTCPYDDCINDMPPDIRELEHMRGIDKQVQVSRLTCAEKKKNERRKELREQNKEKIAARGREYRMRNRDKIKKYRKEYYEKNKAEVAAKGKLYREKNKDKIAERRKIYYQENKEKILARGRIYYKNNRDRIVAYNKEYNFKNKEKISAHSKDTVADKTKRGGNNDTLKGSGLNEEV